MEQSKTFQIEFVTQAIYRMEESLRMVKICMGQISEDTIWKKPNATTNSIGNLILHLCGNITQYGISSLRKEKDERNRDEEFTVKEGYSKGELLEKLESTVREAENAFKEIEPEEFLRKRKVQGFEFSGIGNIIHVVEHFSYHAGQIALWTKLLNNQDLGFYNGIDLTVKNDT